MRRILCCCLPGGSSEEGEQKPLLRQRAGGRGMEKEEADEETATATRSAQAAGAGASSGSPTNNKAGATTAAVAVPPVPRFTPTKGPMPAEGCTTQEFYDWLSTYQLGGNSNLSSGGSFRRQPRTSADSDTLTRTMSELSAPTEVEFGSVSVVTQRQRRTTVADIMLRRELMIACTPMTPISEVIELMVKYKVSSVVVLDERTQQVRGLATQLTLIQGVMLQAVGTIYPISRIMSKRLAFVRPDACREF